MNSVNEHLWSSYLEEDAVLNNTEPKIKIYALAHADDQHALNEKIKKYKESAKRLTEV